MKTISEILEDLQLEEILDETFEIEQIEEARKVVVRFRNGKRQRKLKCGAGMKNDGLTRCVRMSGKERVTRRMAQRKRLRTVRQRKALIRIRSQRKRKISMRRRHAAGL